MSLGTSELIIIFVLVLILFGPQRLPELARGLGKGIRELKKASAEVQQQLSVFTEYNEQDEHEFRSRRRAINSRLPSAAEAYEEDDDVEGTSIHRQTGKSKASGISDDSEAGSDVGSEAAYADAYGEEPYDELDAGDTTPRKAP